MDNPVPVVLFAFNRSGLLIRTLNALKENAVPLLYVFCDGPRDEEDELEICEVTRIVGEIDWCETHVVFRKENMGLGRSVKAGINSVFKKHERLLVAEDDILWATGTYAYLVKALERYENEKKVMSVSAWSHPGLHNMISPTGPYFDGRFSCWGWGTWRRAWRGMRCPARYLLWLCYLFGRDVGRYGEDIPDLASRERRINVWDGSFALLHILRKGFCLHPPTALSRHIGFGEHATNAASEEGLDVELPLKAPKIDEVEWPSVVEYPRISEYWKKLKGNDERPLSFRLRQLLSRFKRLLMDGIQ